MFDYKNPVFLYGGLGISLLSYIAILRNWKLGLYLLILFLPFIGSVVTIANSQLPLLAIDFVFVFACYLSFFIVRKGAGVFDKFPNHITLLGSLFVALVLVQCFNPNLYNFFVALVGVKVWLLYIPLIYIGAACARDPEDLKRLLSLIVLPSLIPCGLGIYQWYACGQFGYQETMNFFYGDQASDLTQGFQSFDFGMRIYRIPSTFRYVVQYSNYALAIVAIGFALSSSYKNSIFKRNLARTGFFLSLVAVLLSGARAMFVFAPMLLMLIYWFYKNITGTIRLIFIFSFMAFVILFIGDLNFTMVFDNVYNLFFHYGDQLVKGGLVYSISEFPFGKGTGMNTGPARHVIPERLISYIFENYYAKAIIELGILGGLILGLFFLMILIQGYRVHSSLRTKEYRAMSSSLLAYIVVMMINSFKGWPLDLTPSNVYFWLFIGLLFGLDGIEQRGEKFIFRDDVRAIDEG